MHMHAGLNVDSKIFQVEVPPIFTGVTDDG